LTPTAKVGASTSSWRLAFYRLLDEFFELTVDAAADHARWSDPP
jgi:hypothetical protein